MKFTLLLLLLPFYGGNAFTFTCNQVKKLIREKTKFTTDNACVSLDEYIPTSSGFVTEVFFEDSSGRGGRWSFSEVALIGCVSQFSSMGYWTIVTDRSDGGEGIDCDYEFTVFFSSIETILVTAKSDGLHHQSYKAYNFTINSPRGGMLIDFSCKDTTEPLNFYTGLGNGAAEEMFYYGSSQCDERLSLYAWDTAITINVPRNGYFMITYFGTGPYLSLGEYSYDVLLLGSGKSNAIVQHGDDDKFVWLSPSMDDDLYFYIDGFTQFDTQTDNSLVVSAQCKHNNCTGSVNSLSSGDIHLQLEADFLAINYLTNVSNDQWKDSDMFFLRISTTTLDVSPLPSSTPSPKPNTDYSCGCDLINGNASYSPSLWVDIFFIVDVSKSMDNDGIQKASSMIDSIVNSLTIGNGVSKLPQKYSRVGVIAVSDKAEAINNLDTPVQNPLNLSPASSSEADIGNGIELALELFLISPRSTRQLIYIIAASDSSHTDRSSLLLNAYDATFAADVFKAKGGIIAVTEVDSSLSITSFNNLASPGYFNAGFSSDVNKDLQLICDANCFCQSGLTYFTGELERERETAKGGCYHSSSLTDPYVLAKDSCQSEGSILTTIHSQDKQTFLLTLVPPKKPFWIGNEYNGNSWEWIDDSTSSYSNWSSGQPDSSKGRCSYSQQTQGFNSAWFSEDCADDHFYICQRPPCTVDQFCQPTCSVGQFC